jgi:hypothetical protein
MDVIERRAAKPADVAIRAEEHRTIRIPQRLSIRIATAPEPVPAKAGRASQ